MRCPQVADELFVAPLYIEPLLEQLEPFATPTAGTRLEQPPPPSPSSQKSSQEKPRRPPSPPPSQPPRLPITASSFLSRLWQRLLLEPPETAASSAGGRRSAQRLLDALGAVYAVYGGAEPALPCVPPLVAWLKALPPPAHRAEAAARSPRAAARAASASGALPPRERAALRVLSYACKHAQNIAPLVEAGGVEALSALLERTPLHAPLVDAAMRASLPTLAEGERDALEEAAAYELDRFAPPARAAACGVAVDALDLLQTVALSSRRLSRVLCASPRLERH